LVYKPSSDSGPGHGLIGQGPGKKTVFYISERIDETAYAGVDASADGQAVLDGPEDANGGVLGELRAWVNFL